MTSLKRPGYAPSAKRILANPAAEQLKELTGEMPNARLTGFGNFNVQSKVVARSNASTFIVADTQQGYSLPVVSRAQADLVAAMQDKYICSREMIVIDGSLGKDSPLSTQARLVIEKSNANIAGMQQQLYFQAPVGGEPELTVVYTPNLAAVGFPDDRVILVDLETGVTRVLNSDYFGESKKGGLRMWNQRVYHAGALPLHAGAKVVPTKNRGERLLLIVGLSGTGKTTTTFTVQNNSLPVQDDFVALQANGRIVTTEDGCFAKTFGLDPKHEPVIYGAVSKPTAYLENVSQKVVGGPLDFNDDTYTRNGRAVFGMKDLSSGYRAADSLGVVSAMLILNRNQNIIPAVARLTGAQAAAYFMLGETQGTEAGGKAEAGKFLRVPGTTPFFPLSHELQGNRFLEIHSGHPFEVFLLNTGRVGGADEDSRSMKVSIPVSSAIVKGIADGSITWTKDPDFGYEVAAQVPGIEDAELLQPRSLYERQRRGQEYADTVRQFQADRLKELRKYPGLNPSIIAAIS